MKLTFTSGKDVLRFAPSLVTLSLLLTACGGAGTGAPKEGQPAVPTALEFSVYQAGGSSGALSFAAYQDGDGAWQPLLRGEQGYRFTLTDAQGRYGIAYVCEGKSNVAVLQLTAAEVPEPAALCQFVNSSPNDAPKVTLKGNFKGAGGFVQVNGRNTPSAIEPFKYFYFSNSVGQDSYEQQVEPGTYDVSAQEGGDDSMPGKLLILRDVKIAGPTTLDIDMNKSFTLERHTLKISNFVAPGESPQSARIDATEEFLNGFTGGPLLLARGGAPESDPVSRPIDMVPLARQQAADLHRLAVSSSSGTTFKFYETFFKAPRDLSVRLPDSQSFSFQTDRAAKLTYRWFWAASDGLAVSLGVSGASTEDYERGVYAVLSKGWLQGALSYTAPNFSALTGWQQRWNLSSSATFNWKGSVSSRNKDSDAFWITAGVAKFPADPNAYLGQAGLEGLGLTSAGQQGQSQP